MRLNIPGELSVVACIIGLKSLFAGDIGLDKKVALHTSHLGDESYGEVKPGFP
eukprot:COSAG02_NODE_30599_length_548_cov_1.095768_1_plen_52_part_01